MPFRRGKLLDFGLAKSSIIDITAEVATVQKPLTNQGTILGTFQFANYDVGADGNVLVSTIIRDTRGR